MSEGTGPITPIAGVSGTLNGDALGGGPQNLQETGLRTDLRPRQEEITEYRNNKITSLRKGTRQGSLLDYFSSS